MFKAEQNAKERPYLMKIGRDSLGFKSGLDWPEGGWQKGATTTLLLETWHGRPQNIFPHF